MDRRLVLGLCLLTLACSDNGDGSEATGAEPSAGQGNPPTMTGDGDATMMMGDGDATMMMGDGDATMMMGDGDATMMMGDGDTTMMENGTSGYRHIGGGTFGPLTGYEASTASGAALIAVGDGGTEVSLQVNGLSPMTEYPAHVHALPCALSGGGHYKIDPSVEDTVAENELWPAFTTAEDGTATAALVATHVARADAMSIVIHDPDADNAKMLCADLLPTGFALSSQSGALAAFADAEQADQGIMGMAMLARSATGTTVSISVAGLSADSQYGAHVHALPCGTGNAGGHYKLDPSVEEALAENELWPSIMPDAMGEASNTVMSNHVARADAQSVVIHRETMAGAPKVACADLTAEPKVFTTSGDAILFDLATERGLAMMAAQAEMNRGIEGDTTVSVTVSGLTASTEYPIHVHDRPCGVASGGGHYKFDPSVMDTVEENEIFLTLTTDAMGAGTREVEVAHHARAEAQALVIHDADGMRLACIPLQ